MHCLYLRFLYIIHSYTMYLEGTYLKILNIELVEHQWHLLIFTIFTWCRRWWQWLLSCQCCGIWAHGPDSQCEVGMGLGAKDAQSHNLYESRGKSWKDMHCWLSKGEFPSHVCISNWDWTLPTSSIRVGKAGRSISIVFGGEFLH